MPRQGSAFAWDRVEAIRRAVLDDWNRTIHNVEWNPAAALQLIQFILPATTYWLVDKTRRGHSENHQQHMSEERYWIRAINESLGGDDVRDQSVFRDIQTWLQAPDITAELVTKLTRSPQYAEIWENFAGVFFANRPVEILRLCEQVIRRILCDQGSLASDNSQGFIHTWRFAHRRVSRHPENRAWLQNRISDAASVSIAMVNALWHYYGNPGQYSILRNKHGGPVRQHVLDTMRAGITNGPALIARLSANESATLYQLIFDPGDDDGTILADVQSWMWMGSSILDAMKIGNTVAAANCGRLLGVRVSGLERMTVNTEVLDQFFGTNATEVIDILESMIDNIPEVDQLLVRNVVAAAREHLARGDLPDEQEGESDAD